MSVTPGSKKWIAYMACLGVGAALGTEVINSILPPDVSKFLMACNGVFLIVIAVFGLIRTFLPSFDERRRAVPMLAGVSLPAARMIMVTSGIVLIPLGWWCIRSYFS